MNIKHIALLLCTVLFMGANAQLTVNGIVLPAGIKAGTTDLVLNGGGITQKVLL
jgi:hypothetical protein